MIGRSRRRVVALPGPLQVWDDSLMEFLPPSGGTHTYTVRAFDPSGNLSSRSNAVTVRVP
jgi:hypothetical protein